MPPRLLVISVAVAAVSLIGGFAVLSLNGNTPSPAEPDHSAPPTSVASPSNGAVGATITAISDGAGVVALVATEISAVNEEAVVSGRVEKLSGACVGIAYPDGSNAVVVWPAGTTFAEDSSGLAVPRNGAVAYVSQLTAAGGFATIDEVGLRDQLPPDCEATVAAYINDEPTR